MNRNRNANETLTLDIVIHGPRQSREIIMMNRKMGSVHSDELQTKDVDDKAVRCVRLRTFADQINSTIIDTGELVSRHLVPIAFDKLQHLRDFASAIFAHKHARFFLLIHRCGRNLSNEINEINVI